MFSLIVGFFLSVAKHMERIEGLRALLGIIGLIANSWMGLRMLVTSSTNHHRFSNRYAKVYWKSNMGSSRPHAFWELSVQCQRFVYMESYNLRTWFVDKWQDFYLQVDYFTKVVQPDIMQSIVCSVHFPQASSGWYRGYKLSMFCCDQN